MKIRNHRRYEWVFAPHKESNLKYKSFKYKSDLMSYLTKNTEQSVNGEVLLEEYRFDGSGPVRTWCVWYNSYEHHTKGARFKIELRQQDFRGKKFMFRKTSISKSAKRYFAFSDKVTSLMCHIKQDDGTILKKDAERLVQLFYKRGYKDFEPTEDDTAYITYYLQNDIDFFHWSDRCNWLRTKAVIEYFRKLKLIE